MKHTQGSDIRPEISYRSGKFWLDGEIQISEQKAIDLWAQYGAARFTVVAFNTITDILSV